MIFRGPPALCKMAAVVAASRSLAKCWLRPAVRAVSRVFTLLGSSESHPLLSPSLLSPQAARLSRKPPASGMARNVNVIYTALCPLFDDVYLALISY